MLSTYATGMRANQRALSSSNGRSSCLVQRSSWQVLRRGCRRQSLAAIAADRVPEQQHSKRGIQQATAALVASGLATMMLMHPGPVLAADLPAEAQQEAQALSVLLPAGSLQGSLPAAEAPGLVADSGSVVLEGVKGIVESGLQDLAANSMTAVGGPVTGDVLSASVNQAAGDSTAAPSEPAQPQEQQHSTPPVQQPQPPIQQQQRRQRMPAVWCHAWQAYCDALEQSPLATKVYTGVVGTLIGDLVAQILSHTSQQQQQQQQQQGSSKAQPGSPRRAPGSSSGNCFQFDALRAGRLCLYSAVIGTPMGHYWYALLESAVLPATPLAPAAVASKVVLDQFVQTPFGMALFFAVMKLLEGKPRQVQQELQSKMVPALLANWKLWPAAQLINFTVIPEEQRILYGNVVGIIWTCVISNMQQASATAAPACASAATAAVEAAETSGAGVAEAQPGAAAQACVAQEYAADGLGALSLRRRSSSVAA